MRRPVLRQVRDGLVTAVAATRLPPRAKSVTSPCASAGKTSVSGPPIIGVTEDTTKWASPNP
jgi:hypothetical protein